MFWVNRRDSVQQPDDALVEDDPDHERGYVEKQSQPRHVVRQQDSDPENRIGQAEPRQRRESLQSVLGRERRAGLSQPAETGKCPIEVVEGNEQESDGLSGRCPRAIRGNGFPAPVMQDACEDENENDRKNTGKADVFLFLGQFLPEIIAIAIFDDTADQHDMFDDREHEGDGLKNEGGHHGNPFRAA